MPPVSAILLTLGLVVAACAGNDSAAPNDGDLPPASGPEFTTTQPPTSDEPDSTAPSTDDPPSTTTTTVAPTTTTAPPTTVPLAQLALSAEPVARLDRPIAFVQRPGSTDFYAAAKGGRVHNISQSAVALDVSGEVSGGNEQGLLGLEFASDGSQMFVNFTNRSGNTVVRRYDMDGDAADTSTAVDIITVAQERSNHNGGHLAFGPDGFLYIGLGDGGGGGDPGDNGQNPFTLLGSMLRIQPTGDGYEIPSANPYADAEDGAAEVFMWGLRNPWRYSFDPANGDLWIGDVGQDRFEEIDVIRAGEQAGANLGWNELEGFEVYRSGVAPADHVPPIAAYAQTDGRCSVTGGVVYRGSRIPSLVGTYVFGDFCNGEILGLDADGDGEIVQLDIDRIDQIVSFGVDAAGEIYPVSLGGTIYRLTG